MKTRTWPYGTTKRVNVQVANRHILLVTDEAEGYVLAGHGIEELPEVGSKGTITFTDGGPTGGYWKFQAS